MQNINNLQSCRRAAVMVIFLAGLAGCGEEGSGSLPRTNQDSLTVSTKTEDNVFSPERLSVPAGAEVTMTVDNTGELPHTFTIRELEVDTGTIAPGQSETVTFTAPSETTQFICVPHELEGMTGELLIGT